MKENFAHLQEQYTRLCKLLVPYKPRYSYQSKIQTRRQDDGAPHIEFVNGKYDFVVTERGLELERQTAETEDELLYWLLSDVTTGIASEFELDNRVLGQDSRRQWFAKNVELLARLNPEWACRKESEYAKILTDHPFRDEA